LNCQIKQGVLEKFKKRLMRKLLFIGTMLLGIAACSGSGSGSEIGALVNRGSENSPRYYMTLEAEDGDKTKKKVEFMIDKLIIKELKLNEAKIREICDDGIRYADWNVKFKPTYKSSETASLFYDKETKRIKAMMSGTAENAYGVPDNIYTFIPFDIKGKMIEDKDGLPEIY
jgi:ABC-type glycerol-3-phosphate transport system substrate-binding protein